jgi:hypothetical protein
MKADTPRTDEVLLHCPSHLQEVALANLAQDLERELFHSLKNQLKARSKVERLTNLLSLEREGHEATKKLCCKILDSTRKTPSFEWHRKNKKVFLK